MIALPTYHVNIVFAFDALILLKILLIVKFSLEIKILLCSSSSCKENTVYKGLQNVCRDYKFIMFSFLGILFGTCVL